MLLDVETVTAEEVDISIAEVASEDMEEEVEEVEEDISEEFTEEAAAYMKMKLTSEMSPVTLKIQSGLHSQTIHVKVSLRTRYAQSSWQVKRGAPPAPSVLKGINKISQYLISSLGFKTKAEMNLYWQ